MEGARRAMGSSRVARRRSRFRSARFARTSMSLLRDPAWMTRHVRGAPVGRNPDGAPVLFSRRVQVKVYRGQGSDSDLPLRVLRDIRSINSVAPSIRADD